MKPERPWYADEWHVVEQECAHDLHAARIEFTIRWWAVPLLLLWNWLRRK